MKAIIIGGGIGGLSAALALERVGIRCDIFEQAEEIREVGAGLLRSSENVTVSWPAVDTAGFALEQAGPLAAPAGWVTNSATVTNDGANKSVTLSTTNRSQFFRLRRP